MARLLGPDLRTSLALYSRLLATHVSPTDPVSPGTVALSFAKVSLDSRADTVTAIGSTTNSSDLGPPVALVWTSVRLGGWPTHFSDATVVVTVLLWSGPIRVLHNMPGPITMADP